jgi:hypothetical protein
VLVDTPGMLWPKIAMESDGLMLAASHAVGTNAVIEEEVAEFLGDVLLERYPQLLSARYGFKTEGMDGVGVIEGVAARRGFRVRGGEFDFEKAAHVLLQDYRSGALGRISLETPDSRAAALEQHRIAMEEKARHRGGEGGEARRKKRRAASAEPDNATVLIEAYQRKSEFKSGREKRRIVIHCLLSIKRISELP